MKSGDKKLNNCRLPGKLLILDDIADVVLI
jgi:hypothetical protein